MARITHARSIAWLELRALVETGSLQLGVQVIGFVAGLAVIWLLPVREFAYYTVANAMLGTLAVLTDCGVAQGVMARGGSVWRDRAALSGAFAGGARLRRRLAVAGVLISLPVLFLLLTQQGASTPIAALTAVSIVPLFLSGLSSQLLEVVLKLHQQLRALQLIHVRGAALRLCVVAAAVAALPYAWIASVGAGLAHLWVMWRTRTLVGNLVDLAARPDPAATRAIVHQVRRTAPGAVYFAFSAQINIWLISVFGTTEAVAEVGALGRLAMVFTILSAVVSMLYIPRFARMSPNDDGRVRDRFWLMQAGLALSMGVLVALVALFPSPALALLGSKYAGLTHEVKLAVAAGAMALLSGSAYALAAARGIVLTPMIVVPAALSVQVLLAFVLPISTVAGVLWLGVLSNVAFWLMHAVNFSYTIARNHAR